MIDHGTRSPLLRWIRSLRQDNLFIVHFLEWSMPLQEVDGSADNAPEMCVTKMKSAASVGATSATHHFAHHIPNREPPSLTRLRRQPSLDMCHQACSP